jgi:predicted Zn-dependent peptidase
MFQDVYDGFSSTTLPNGLTVSTQQRRVSWEYLGILVHAGAKEDPAGRQGLAHLVEHLVGENVGDLTFAQLEKRFQALGATAHFGSTSYLSTSFDVHLPACEARIQEALALLGTMLLEGQLTRNVQEEKAVILHEYHLTYPHAFARSWALKGRPWLFESHPRLNSFHSTLGVLEEWMSCPQSEIQAFYNRYYTPANMSLVCIGALAQDRLLHLLQQTPFAALKPGERTPLPAAYVPRLPSRQEQVIHLSPFSQLVPEQASCTLEWVLPLHFERYQVVLFADLLEERLTEELRYQRCWTYEVSVSSRYYQDCRVLTVHYEVAPERIAEATDLVWQILGQIPHTPERFRRAKQERIDAFSRLDCSGDDLLKVVLDDLAYAHRLIPFAEELYHLEQTDFAAIVELAAFLTPERHCSFILRP